MTAITYVLQKTLKMTPKEESKRVCRKAKTVAINAVGSL